jgi:hypothetical protein
MAQEPIVPIGVERGGTHEIFGPLRASDARSSGMSASPTGARSGLVVDASAPILCYSQLRDDEVVVAGKPSHAVVRREHVRDETREPFVARALDCRDDERPSETLPLIRVFDDEGEFGFPETDALPPSDTVNRAGIIRFNDDERSAAMIIHAAQTVRLGGTKLWLRCCEPQVTGCLAASVVKLDQRGLIRGRYRSQRAVHAYPECVSVGGLMGVEPTAIAVLRLSGLLSTTAPGVLATPVLPG